MKTFTLYRDNENGMLYTKFELYSMWIPTHDEPLEAFNKELAYLIGIGKYEEV